jgi:drug/metabolite transporter (DMT)-like permease
VPEFLRSPLEWFWERPGTQKALIGAAALVVLIAASRVVSVIATLIFIVAAIAFLVQLVRRRPTWGWMFVALGALGAAVLFGATASAIYGI